MRRMVETGRVRNTIIDRDSDRVATTRRRWLVGAGSLLALMITASACGNDAEQQSAVDRLESEIGSMPGVESFSADYADDFTHGTHLDVSARMWAATDEQVEAVARRIDEVGDEQFDGFDRSTEIHVGENVELKRNADILPERIAADTRALRQLRATVPSASIEWFRSPISGSWLELSDTDDTGVDVFAAVRTAVGDEPTDVRLRPNEPEPMWSVTFPMPVDREEVIRRALADTPLAPISIGVEDGVVTRLGVGVTDPGVGTYDELVAVITATAPIRGPVLDLQWHGDRPGDGKHFSGSVDVGGCSYPKTGGESDPQRYYTPDAVTVQTRIRAEFDTCE